MGQTAIEAVTGRHGVDGFYPKGRKMHCPGGGGKKDAFVPQLNDYDLRTPPVKNIGSRRQVLRVRRINPGQAFRLDLIWSDDVCEVQIEPFRGGGHGRWIEYDGCTGAARMRGGQHEGLYRYLELQQQY